MTQPTPKAARQAPQEQLVRVVYHSEAKMPFNGALLGALNMTAQENNARGRVTGLLLHHQGQFFGVIEGERSVVESCFQRVARDRRHYGMKVLSNTGVKLRAFDCWKMGVSEPGEVPAAMRRGVFAITDLMPPDSPKRGDVPEVRAMVRKFLAGFATLAPQPMKKVG